jgi:peptide/nickel transport system permease protein
VADLAPPPVGIPEPLVGAEVVEFGVAAEPQWRRILRRFVRHRLAVASLALLVVLTAIAFLGETVARYGYEELNRTEARQSPSWSHWFGTDNVGHDLFAQVLRGARRSITVGIVVALLATSVGTAVGALAGYYRGILDQILMRFTDLFLTIPTLAVLLVVAARYRGQSGNWLALSFVIAAFAWMPLARVVRGMFLSLREREFVEAARALGANDRRIILRHLLPNAAGPIIVNATLLVGVAIVTETALSFLGFGIAPPDTSLGRLVAQAVNSARTNWWRFYLPGLYLVLICLTINFVGDGLRDAIDPRQERVRA